MILSDRSIREAIDSGRLGVVPFDPELIQPSSIDVRLDNKFLVFRNTKRAYIDIKQPAEDLMEMIEVGAEEPMFLHPHEFVLGSTVERVRIPNDLVGRLEGRSSSAAWASSFTARPGTSIQRSKVMSPSKSATWPTCPSRSIQACVSARSRLPR